MANANNWVRRLRRLVFISRPRFRLQVRNNLGTSASVDFCTQYKRPGCDERTYGGPFSTEDLRRHLVYGIVVTSGRSCGG